MRRLTGLVLGQRQESAFMVVVDPHAPIDLLRAKIAARILIAADVFHLFRINDPSLKLFDARLDPAVWQAIERDSLQESSNPTAVDDAGIRHLLNNVPCTLLPTPSSSIATAASAATIGDWFGFETQDRGANFHKVHFTILVPQIITPSVVVSATSSPSNVLLRSPPASPSIQTSRLSSDPIDTPDASTTSTETPTILPPSPPTSEDNMYTSFEDLNLNPPSPSTIVTDTSHSARLSALARTNSLGSTAVNPVAPTLPPIDVLDEEDEDEDDNPSPRAPLFPNGLTPSRLLPPPIRTRNRNSLTPTVESSIYPDDSISYIDVRDFILERRRAAQQQLDRNGDDRDDATIVPAASGTSDDDGSPWWADGASLAATHDEMSVLDMHDDCDFTYPREPLLDLVAPPRTSTTTTSWSSTTSPPATPTTPTVTTPTVTTHPSLLRNILTPRAPREPREPRSLRSRKSSSLSFAGTASIIGRPRAPSSSAGSSAGSRSSAEGDAPPAIQWPEMPPGLPMERVRSAKSGKASMEGRASTSTSGGSSREGTLKGGSKKGRQPITMEEKAAMEAALRLIGVA
ncbi:hypothetical protein HK101_007563 [Irineochytrium annulatum]|nr:hypothetical protein HK101_007563 [Irineochytrium annulatum]